MDYNKVDDIDSRMIIREFEDKKKDWVESSITQFIEGYHDEGKGENSETVSQM